MNVYQPGEAHHARKTTGGSKLPQKKENKNKNKIQKTNNNNYKDTKKRKSAVWC